MPPIAVLLASGWTWQHLPPTPADDWPAFLPSGQYHILRQHTVHDEMHDTTTVEADLLVGPG